MKCIVICITCVAFYYVSVLEKILVLSFFGYAFLETVPSTVVRRKLMIHWRYICFRLICLKIQLKNCHNILFEIVQKDTIFIHTNGKILSKFSLTFLICLTCNSHYLSLFSHITFIPFNNVILFDPVTKSFSFLYALNTQPFSNNCYSQNCDNF